jgi:hypothetical protein
LIMTLTSNPPGIPDAPRLSGWIGESLGGEPPNWPAFSSSRAAGRTSPIG